MHIDWWQIFLAALPVLFLIVLMGILKMSGDKSAIITLIVTILIAMLACSFPLADTGFSIVYGILKAFFPILFVIIMAIFSYNTLLHTGKMELIQEQFTAVSSDKSVQVLLLTWGFGGLLEGMAGFGTAVAIPASILISLGFNPIFSAIVSLIANSVATGFGAIGIPVKVLAEQAGITDIQTLSANVVLQLSPLMLLIPFVILFLTDSNLKSLPKQILLSLIVGTVSLITQYAAAKYMGAETPAIMGSIASIIVILLYARITEPKKEKTKNIPKHTFSESLKAWSVYGLILLLIILTSPLLPLRDLLAPILTTTFRFNIFDVVAGADALHTIQISWLIDAGVILFVGSVLGGLIQGARFIALLKVLGRVIIQQRKTMVTVCSLIALSSVMDFAGMIGTLATAVAAATGAFYPLFAPAIGSLGTFLTGSDTSSNILFGKLQSSVANSIGADPNWLTASNTAGATGGKIISPQSIAIATSATGQQGQEGEIMKKAIPYALVYIIIAGLMVYFMPQVTTSLW